MTLTPDIFLCNECNYQSDTLDNTHPQFPSERYGFKHCNGTLIPMYSQESLVKELEGRIDKFNPSEYEFDRYAMMAVSARVSELQSLLETITRTEKEGV